MEQQPPARLQSPGCKLGCGLLLSENSLDHLSGPVGKHDLVERLRALESAGLKDCARCTAELEERLSRNPHYRVLGKLAEAEKLLEELSAPAR